MPDDDGFDPYLDQHDKNNRLSANMFSGGRMQNSMARSTSAVSRLRNSLREFAMSYHRTGLKPDALAIDNLLELASGAGVLVWTSNHRYTYCAVFANGKWFITGKGGWYGKNEFSQAEFIDVLLHDLVTDIRFSYDFVELYAPPPF